MTPAATRRLRVLRLRTVAHRTSVIRLAAANAAQTAITDVADRVAQLRAGIVVPAGTHSARDLQSFAELAARLDRARSDLAPALSTARQQYQSCDADRIATQEAVERTDRVQTEAARREAAESALRAEAAHPPRLKKARFGP